MKKTIGYLLSLTFCLIAVSATGQTTIESLREQIRQAEKEISINTDLLNKNQKDQQLSLSQLKLIQSRIRSRRDIVSSLEKQMALLAGQITANNKAIDKMETELDNLKKEYAAMVRSSYRDYRLNNFLVFLFASEDFNDVTRRINFMRRYNRMRELKGEQIKIMTDSLAGQVEVLAQQRAELDGTRKEHGNELTSLGKDENQYQTSVNKLKTQEGNLNRELRTRRDQIAKAQKRIEEIIAEEARRSTGQVRTATEQAQITALSGKFDENKGRLPYPVSGGVIIDRYGTHPHPTQPGLTINNKGVNIAAGRSAEVTAIFEGSVTKVFSVPGLNNCVMLRHGNYITLYANLAAVSVKTGDKVGLNQRVGRLSDSPNNDDNYLHFELWRETTNLNPEQWLRR